LGNGGKGKVAEILKTPELLTSALDPLADGTSGALRLAGR
jgi:hypothetical protein